MKYGEAAKACLIVAISVIAAAGVLSAISRFSDHQIRAGADGTDTNRVQASITGTDVQAVHFDKMSGSGLPAAQHAAELDDVLLSDVKPALSDMRGIAKPERSDNVANADDDDQGPAADQPDEAARFRRLQLKDE